jgi:hypothetical protein
VNASGQEMRAEISDFDIERWTLGVGRFLLLRQ